MAQKNFVIEKGLKIVDVGTDIGVEHIQGSGAPSMDAPKGSLYSDRDTGFHYQKELAGSGADKWKKIATQDDINATIGTWRPEAVVLLTAEAQAPGVRDVVVSPFSDDQGTAVALSAFVVGKFIISRLPLLGSSSAVLLEITDVTGNNVTFAAAPSAMVKDDTFVVEYYLPDSATQENHAIVNYNGSAMVKIADADWGRADAIGLAPSYAAVNGSVTSADTVNSALQKLDGNQQDLITLTGEVQGATSITIPMPSFSHGLNETALVSGQSIAANFDRVNNLLSALWMDQQYIDLSQADTWVDSLQLQVDNNYGGAIKYTICVVPDSYPSPTRTDAVFACEIMAVFSGNLLPALSDDTDFSVYAKVQPSTRNGLPAAAWDPEFRFVKVDLGGKPTAKLQIKLPSSVLGVNSGATVFIRGVPLAGLYG